MSIIGQIEVLRVTDLSRGGAGVARSQDGRAVFLAFTAPGDLVRAKILEEHKRYLKGEVQEVLEASPSRVVPRCAIFGRCGGCAWQHLPYSLQWETKAKGVLQALARAGVILEGPLEEFPAERIWEYRNRIQLRGSYGKMGFYREGSNDLVEAERCEIARPEINDSWTETLEQGRRFAEAFKVEVQVEESGEIQRSWNSPHAAAGFRQVHDGQNEALRAWVRNALLAGGGSSSRILYDLFGGAGNLSKSLKNDFKEIHCVDSGAEPSAQQGSFHLHRKSVTLWLRDQAKGQPGSSHCAIIDPPRSGLGDDVKAIAAGVEKLSVKTLVLIGCDPDSFARDLAQLLKRGWKIRKGATLDLFPQTPHVEAAALLFL